MQLKIHYGTTTHSGHTRATSLGMIAVFCVILAALRAGTLGSCPSISDTVKIPDENLSLTDGLCYSMMATKCFCPFPSHGNITRISYCTSQTNVTYNRILLSTSVVLQVIVIHDVFSLEGEYSHQMANVLWSIAFSGFFTLTDLFWRSECFLHCMIPITFCSAYMLFALSYCDLSNNTNFNESSRNSNNHEKLRRTRSISREHPSRSYSI